jgi:acyl carrier protein
MQQTDILNTLTEIWRDELDDDTITLATETTAKDVKGWDSLTNIQLIVATEKKFNIRFSASEIMGFANVGDLANAISKKLS